jgi:hypothetical protein
MIVLYVTGKDERFCLNCAYGKFLGDRIYCPFVEGSCARFPETITKPAPKFLEKVMELTGYQRIYTDEGRKL